MSPSPPQSTILVKRTDGTFARMTLAELELLKKGKGKGEGGKLGGEKKGEKRRDWSKDDAKSLLEDIDGDVLLPKVGGNDLPEVYRKPAVPASAAPFNAFKHEANLRINATAMRRGPAVAVANMANTDNIANQNEVVVEAKKGGRILNSQLAGKPMVNDITAPPIEMGPVEEIKFMNLTEFRRLSSNPAEAASRLRQKFQTLKDESFLLYMDALSAWRASPLYLQYLKKVIEALIERKPFSAALIEPDGLRLEEVKEIIRMETELF